MAGLASGFSVGPIFSGDLCTLRFWYRASEPRIFEHPFVAEFEVLSLHRDSLTIDGRPAAGVSGLEQRFPNSIFCFSTVRHGSPPVPRALRYFVSRLPRGCGDPSVVSQDLLAFVGTGVLAYFARAFYNSACRASGPLPGAEGKLG
jgi:hypothetical protein